MRYPIDEKTKKPYGMQVNDIKVVLDIKEDKVEKHNINKPESKKK